MLDFKTKKLFLDALEAKLDNISFERQYDIVKAKYFEGIFCIYQIVV